MCEQFPAAASEMVPTPLDFYDVAATFVAEAAETQTPHVLLKQWAHRYPEYAADLAALAYERFIAADTQSSEEPGADEIVASAQRVLDRLRSAAPPMKSLIAEASQAGLSPQELAAALRLDIPTVAKLEQRLLEARTIPSSLIASLAEIVGRTVSEVARYLDAPPRLALNAAYKAKTPPKVSGSDRQSFADALSSSRSLTPQDRDYWRKRLDEDGSVS